MRLACRYFRHTSITLCSTLQVSTVYTHSIHRPETLVMQGKGTHRRGRLVSAEETTSLTLTGNSTADLKGKGTTDQKGEEKADQKGRGDN